MPKAYPLSNGDYEPPKSELSQTLEKLEQGVKDVFESDNYKEYLRVMSKFHNYSVNNTILIAMQKPSASLVAGYQAWQTKFGRFVKKGEKGIKIISPTPRREVHFVQAVDKNGEPEFNEDGRPIITQKQEMKMGYKIAHVFDVNQTEGRNLPNMGANLLNGTVERYTDVMTCIEKAAPCPIVFEEINSGANGYFQHGSDKKIAIREGMSEAQTVKTALHELAHSRMHDVTDSAETSPNRFTKEVQAESVAFVVADHFGIDTSDYSFGYVAGWSSGKETKELKESLNEIKTEAHAIITDIEHGLNEIELARHAELSQEVVFFPEHGYLEIHECDEGWDYTFYDCSMQLVDGGVIESDCNINQAFNEAVELSGLEGALDTTIDIDCESFAERCDQISSSPYLQTMAKATGRQAPIAKAADTQIKRTAAIRDTKHIHAHVEKKDIEKPKPPRTPEPER